MQKKEHEDTIHALLNLHFEKQEEVNRNSKRDFVDLLTNIRSFESNFDRKTLTLRPLDLI
jgi:hypothetical protein